MSVLLLAAPPHAVPSSQVLFWWAIARATALGRTRRPDIFWQTEEVSMLLFAVCGPLSCHVVVAPKTE